MINLDGVTAEFQHDSITRSIAHCQPLVSEFLLRS